MSFEPTALLQQYFGFTEFRPGQREVIEALMTQGAALAVFPTGGGKSLCYQLPALGFDGVTLVVSPLIALMKDQIDFLQARGIAAARLDSSLPLEEVRAISEQMQRGELKLVYVAPERFNNERFVANLRHTPIALFAVDEAHCIAEWGHNFRPDYLKLAEIARDLKVERILALTATATPQVVEEICAGFRIPRECAVVTGFYRPNLNLCTTPVTNDRRDGLLLKRLRSRKAGPTIVYVTLQKTAERIANYLEHAGLPARAYHAGMDSAERTEVQEWWMSSDDHIVVATIAFGMGIDKSNVRYVYHYNLPKGLESYSQEVGRAGRDGLSSTVEMLACPDDVPTLENFAYGDTPTPHAIENLVRELLTSEPEFDIGLYDLSVRHDIRQLVLKTVLTYLELLGILRQGTPFYAGYEIKLSKPLPQLLAEFQGEPKQFLTDVFRHAKHGTTWYALNPDNVAAGLGHERRRVVRALEVLEERGLATVRVADVRQRYSLLQPDADVREVTADLCGRFLRREEQEMRRIQQVLDLVTHDGCQVNALVGYFGEEREAPCGHCTYCVTGVPQELPPPSPLPPLDTVIDAAAVHELRAANAVALGEPRQLARYLCGLTSPAVSRAKLGRNPLFGELEHYRFGDVLAWCEGASS